VTDSSSSSCDGLLAPSIGKIEEDLSGAGAQGFSLTESLRVEIADATAQHK